MRYIENCLVPTNSFTKLVVLVPKVHGESDTHDEVDKGHAVETYSPPCHVAYDADLNNAIPENNRERQR